VLEALALVCGPLLPLGERGLLEHTVATGLAQLATSGNRTLRRPAPASGAGGGAAGISGGGGGGSGAIGSGGGGAGAGAVGLSAALCGGVGSGGDAFRSALLSLACALVQAPRGDGSASGLGPLLSDACASLRGSGAWACHGRGALPAGVPGGLACARAASAVEQLAHPRGLPLAAPHFWPTTAASLARGVATGAATRTAPGPNLAVSLPEGVDARLLGGLDGAWAEDASSDEDFGEHSPEADMAIEAAAKEPLAAFDAKRPRTAASAAAEPAPALATAIATSAEPLKTTVAKAAPLMNPATAAPLAAPLATLAKPAAVASGGAESDELPDIVDSGPDDSDTED
jgi:hypothetical protein